VSAIVQRIRDLLPALPYGLETLLGLCAIEETDAVPTAAVPLGGEVRLLINPDFVARWCHTDEALWSLVMHELHHILLGHTRLFERITPAHNLAFDAVINAMLCRRNPAPAWTALFRDTNPPDVFPGLLLRPPEGFPGPARYPEGTPPACRRILEALYYDNTATFGEIFALLSDGARPLALQAGGLAVGEPTLLGSHDADTEGVNVRHDPGLFQAVRRIVERWPQPPDPLIGRSLDEALSRDTVTIRRRAPDAVIRAALLAAARVGSRRGPRRQPREISGQVAWPGRDRRAFAQLAAGQPPLLYRRPLTGRPRSEGLTPVDVYLDVSGSLSRLLPEVASAVLSCRRWIAPSVYQFSTEVVPVSLGRLARGEILTTGGTCGVAVTAHLAARGSRAAVVVTDGYVGAIPAAHHAACRRARLQVVLTPDGWTGDLAPVAAAIHHLSPRSTP
jgi:hypothetical protein